MASFLRRARVRESSALLSSRRRRWFSSNAEDSLVEHKPGEVGMLSGIPEQHLRRRVLVLFIYGGFDSIVSLEIVATFHLNLLMNIN